MGLFHLINHLRCSGLTDIPTEISCTSLQQQWHKPRGKRIEPEQVMNMVCPKPKRKRKKPPPVCSFTTTNTNYFPQVKHVETLVQAMSNINPNYPFSYLITPCKVDKFTATPLGDVPEGSILSYQIANVKPQLEEELLTEVKTFPKLPIKDVNGPHINCEASVALYLSMDECQELEKRTVLQSKCELWFQEREKRLTASKFGKICKRKKEITPAFFRELSGYQNTIKSASMKYGLENEDRARKMYTAFMKSQSKNVTVYHSGLVINPGMPYLGCTPDGKVYDSEENPPYGLLEIKCPKSKINVDLNECCDETFYCSVSDDELCLKTNHDYYYQVQGQLHISGLTWCDFIVFNGKRVWVQRIRIDNEFCEDMTKKLAIFYENHYLSFYLTRDKYYKAL